MTLFEPKDKKNSSVAADSSSLFESKEPKKDALVSAATSFKKDLPLTGDAAYTAVESFLRERANSLGPLEKYKDRLELVEKSQKEVQESRESKKPGAVKQPG